MKDALSHILDQPASIVAPLILGCVLEREINGHIIRARIVETEAYDETDAASHSYKGKTRRTDIMFGPLGHLYVYFTYGMYYCCNIVVGNEGIGSAVLIRAVEPIYGEEYMKELRPCAGYELSNGPAKLCQALEIDKNLNGHNLRYSPLRLIINTPIEKRFIVQTTRIGISQAKDTLWRFYISGNPYVSKAKHAR